jgi:hypothetical protein
MGDNSYVWLQGLLQGPQGAQGPQGTGFAGSQGPQGAQGAQGQSALSAVVTISTTTVTLTRATHNGKYLRFTNAAGCTVTVNAGVFSDGDVVYLRQAAAGQVAFAGSATVIPPTSKDPLTQELGATASLVFWNTGASADLAGQLEPA